MRHAPCAAGAPFYCPSTPPPPPLHSAKITATQVLEVMLNDSVRGALPVAATATPLVTYAANRAAYKPAHAPSAAPHGRHLPPKLPVARSGCAPARARGAALALHMCSSGAVHMHTADRYCASMPTDNLLPQQRWTLANLHPWMHAAFVFFISIPSSASNTYRIATSASNTYRIATYTHTKPLQHPSLHLCRPHMRSGALHPGALAGSVQLRGHQEAPRHRVLRQGCGC